MDTKAALGLLVVVILVGTAAPGIAQQGGSPVQADEPGDDPPDRPDRGERGPHHHTDGDPGPPDHAPGGDDGEDGADENDADAPDPTPDEVPDLPAPEVTGTSTPEPTDTPTPESTETETPEPTDTPTPESTETPEPTDTPTETATPEGPPDSAAPSVDLGVDGDLTVASIDALGEGETVSIEMAGPATEGEAASVESVDVDVSSEEPFRLAVSRPTADGVDEGPPPGTPVAYFQVDTDRDAVTDATLVVDVDETALPADRDPDDVEVLRYAGGEWTPTETTYREDAGVYAVETPRFSRFAVTVDAGGPIDVVDAEVAADRVQADDEVTVRSIVENDGERTATETVPLTVDGETVATRNVTLEGSQTTTVAFDMAPETSGDRTVAVDGVQAGRVRVADRETTTPSASSLGFPGFGVAAAGIVVVSAVVTGLLAGRRDGR